MTTSFVLDPRRCIAYFTIEKRGLPPAELEHTIGEHLFGCDVCQEVCPWNRTAPPPASRTAPFHPHARWSELDLEGLVGVDEASWAGLSEGTPLRRPGRGGLARNAVLVAASRLARGHDDVDGARRALTRALDHDDPEVRALAAGALGREHLEGAPRDPGSPARVELSYGVAPARPTRRSDP